MIAASLCVIIALSAGSAFAVSPRPRPSSLPPPISAPSPPAPSPPSPPTPVSPNAGLSAPIYNSWDLINTNTVPQIGPVVGSLGNRSAVVGRRGLDVRFDDLQQHSCDRSL